MLNIGRMGRGSAHYYLDAVAHAPADDYHGHGEAPGRWMGSGLDGLGLELGLEVTREALGRVWRMGAARVPAEAASLRDEVDRARTNHDRARQAVDTLRAERNRLLETLEEVRGDRAEAREALREVRAERDEALRRLAGRPTDGAVERA